MIVRRGAAITFMLVAFGGGQAWAQLQPSPLVAAQMQTMAMSQAPGQSPISPLYAAMLAKGQSATYPLVMEGGRCYTILGIGGPGVSDVDFYLHDPTGKDAASDTSTGNSGKIFHCAKWAGTYVVEAKAKKGGGEVVVQIFSPAGAAPVAAIAAAPAPAPVVAAGDPLAAAVDQQAASAAPGQHRVGEYLRGFAAQQDGRTDWYVNLDPGHCYTIVGAAGAGVEALSLFLWAPNNKRVADVKPKAPWAALPYCAAMGGPYHIQAKASRGAGEYRVGIYMQ